MLSGGLQAIELLSNVVKLVWGDSARVELFGSRACGMALTNSDLDLVSDSPVDVVRVDGGSGGDSTRRRSKEMESSGYV